MDVDQSVHHSIASPVARSCLQNLGTKQGERDGDVGVGIRLSSTRRSLDDVYIPIRSKDIVPGYSLGLIQGQAVNVVLKALLLSGESLPQASAIGASLFGSLTRPSPMRSVFMIVP